MKNKKVALLLYSCPFHFPPTINAANILVENGFDTTLFAIEYPDTYQQKLDERVRLVYLDKQKQGLKGILSYLRSFFFLLAFLRRNKTGVLLSYDAKSVMPAWFATRFSAAKWLYHQHDFWDKPQSLWEKFIWKSEQVLMRFADKVSFPQTERAEKFLQLARLKEMPTIVYNGPRKNWRSSTVQINPVMRSFRDQYNYVLIYQGGWAAHFGLERIFEALALCTTHTALVMLGEERKPGVRDSYIQQLEKLGIRERVYLSDRYIAYDELPGFTQYADAAIAILTKEDEPAPFNNRYLIGASNKITEYLACGLPVIVEDSAPNRRFYQQYPIGLLVNSEDARGFAWTIDSLMGGREKREHFSRHNQQLFEREMNFDDQFQKIMNWL